MMESLSKPLKDHKIKPTRLYSRNMNVDDLNAREFKLIKEVAYEFKAIDDYGHLSYAPSFKSRLNDIQARPLIKLKVRRINIYHN
ncbi:expressed protein [Phakopsora pachyrhizi]|uniref:Expressed protein n=1 Tax=Phakopsora pachyrhizi TaxID=170000 RepID=A0AAV0BLA7_PHAPC|nr:expressed protein [Phakopsora pachyrhizi]